MDSSLVCRPALRKPILTGNPFLVALIIVALYSKSVPELTLWQPGNLCRDPLSQPCVGTLNPSVTAATGSLAVDDVGGLGVDDDDLAMDRVVQQPRSHDQLFSGLFIS